MVMRRPPPPLFAGVPDGPRFERAENECGSDEYGKRDQRIFIDIANVVISASERMANEGRSRPLMYLVQIMGSGTVSTTALRARPPVGEEAGQLESEAREELSRLGPQCQDASERGEPGGERS